MSFPTYGFTTKVDNVDTIMAADVNGLQNAVQEIADIVDALPSGGGATFPMAEGVWYSPLTAIGGLKSSDLGEMLPSVNIGKAAPIQIFEPCTISKVGFWCPAPSGTTTALISLHDVSVNGNVGVKIDDLGSITFDNTYAEYPPLEDACSVAVDPGWYFLVIAADAEFDLQYITVNINHGGYSGPIYTAYDGDEPAIGFEIASTGIGTAIPSDLTSETQEPSNKAPYILFQITHP
jgi:hypothetical protein